jgi:hypothetical protein
MKKTDDPKPKFARLPNGQKVRIKSQDGDTALVMRRSWSNHPSALDWLCSIL